MRRAGVRAALLVVGWSVVLVLGPVFVGVVQGRLSCVWGGY